MKRFIKSLKPVSAALLAVILTTSVAMAAYTANILVQETSGTAYPMLACNVTLNVDHLVANNYINVDALDTRVEAGSDELPHMLASGNASVGRIQFALPVGGNTAQTVDFTTGSSNLTHFPVIPGYDGYVTVEKAANLEPSDNFSTLIDGWIDTTAGANKNLALKPSALNIFVSDTVAENITAQTLPGRALHFAGIGNVERADEAAISAISPLTVELWIRTTDATAAFQGLVNKDAAGNHEWTLALNNGTSTLAFYIWDDNINAYIGRSDTAAAVNDGNWHYIYASWNGSATAASVELWTDNVQVDDTNLIQNVFVAIEDKAAPLQVGTYQTNSGNFTGDIDEVRISNVVRTAAERSVAWNNGAGYPFSDDASTVVLYHLDETGATAIDHSSNGLDGTITGTSRIDGFWAIRRVTATGVSDGVHSCNVSAAPLLFAPESDLHFAADANSYVDCGISYNGSTKLWSSCWFKLDSVFSAASPNPAYLWGKRISGNDQCILFLNAADGKLTFSKQTGGLCDFSITSAQTSWAADTWYHVVFSISSANAVRMRINSGTAVTDPDVSAMTNGGNFVIGSRHIAVGESPAHIRFTGEIANWVTATDDLTVGEENLLYYNTFPGDATDLWYLDEGTGTTIISYGYTPTNGTAGTANTWQDESRPCKFAIAVDGTSEDGFARPIIVPDTTDNWTMYQNNSLIYSDNLSIMIDDTVELWFRPTSIIQSIDASTGNLTDLTNIYNHGIITWGSNPTGVAVTMGGLVSDFAGAGDPDPLVQQDIVPVMTTPSTASDAAILVTLATDPFYPAVEAVSSVTNISIVLQYQLGLFFLALALFVACYKMFPHLFICGVLFCVPIGYGVALTVFPFTFIAVIIVILIGSAVMEGRQPA